MQDENMYIELEKIAKQNKMEIYKISAVTGQGIKELLNRVIEVLKTLPKEELVQIEDKKVYTLEENEVPFTIRKEEGIFIVEGKAVEKVMRSVNISDNESLYYFHKHMSELGLDDALKKAGIKDEDVVKIGDYELEWYD